jgi:hypothetical protein
MGSLKTTAKKSLTRSTHLQITLFTKPVVFVVISFLVANNNESGLLRVVELIKVKY